MICARKGYDSALAAAASLPAKAFLPVPAGTSLKQAVCFLGWI